MTIRQSRILASAFRKDFKADVEAEPQNGHGRYRFTVVSNQFKKMSHLQRQDALWKVVDKVLPREATMDVSLIIAFTPEELAVKN
jgi:acid stress-induced BolA-like protein IbaG/YrbA